MHGDLKIAERSTDDIPREISGDLRNNILAGLWRVHSKYEEGDKSGDCVTACLRDAYDVNAEAHLHAGVPLTEKLLTEIIPGTVFQWGVERKWLTYPPMKYVPRPKRDVINGYIVPFEPYPEAELTAELGGYKVTDSYKADILQQLASRVAHWRGEALLSIVIKSADSEPEESIGVDLAPPDKRNGEGVGPNPPFPARARWLQQELRKRSWNKHDLSEQGQLDHKTVERILDGLPVRAEVLRKVALGLSMALSKVDVLDIPED